MREASSMVFIALVVTCLAQATALTSQNAASPATALSFEVVSIKPRQAGIQPPQTRMVVTAGRIGFQAVLLQDCLRWAFGLADYQITGGPSWIARGLRFDIEAKAAGPVTDNELRQMFRTLLQDRFAFRAHRGTLETRVSLLTVAQKGPQLKPAADDAPRTDDWRMSPLFQTSRPGPGSAVIRQLSTQRVTMRYFAEYLTRQLRMPVIDRTGLEGDFAFSIEWPADPAEPGAAPREPGAPPPPGAAPDLFGTAGRAALRDQLGLVLTPARTPIDVLVIDSVEEPTPN